MSGEASMRITNEERETLMETGWGGSEGTNFIVYSISMIKIRKNNKGYHYQTQKRNKRLLK